LSPNDKAALKAVVLAMESATVHADDGDAVTEDWLRSVGFTETSDNDALRLEFRKPYGEDTAVFHLQCSDRHNLLDCPWEIWVQSIECEREGAMLPCEPQTRGQLRRLCEALGVPLKEHEPKKGQTDDK
jgi:hypothetical protein